MKMLWREARVSKSDPYSAVKNGEFHTLTVHLNNEKQPLHAARPVGRIGYE